MCCFFFFQAEDGIRDVAVTGVQTCALPICVGAYGNRLRPDDELDGLGRQVLQRGDAGGVRGRGDEDQLVDRKSTRLNSSHGYISYAVFCLKKKKRENTTSALM